MDSLPINTDCPRKISVGKMPVPQGAFVVLCTNQLTFKKPDEVVHEPDQDLVPTARKRSDSNMNMISVDFLDFSSLALRKSETLQGLPEKISDKNIDQFLDSFDNVISDCDGVLWRGNKAIEGSVEMINKFVELGKRVFYITNDCNNTRAKIAEKAFKLGFPGTEENVMTPTYALTEYLQRRGFNQKVYVVGMPGIAHELNDQDIAHYDIKPEPTAEEQYDMNDIMGDIQLDPEVGAVVIGLDPHVSIRKLSKAASYVHKDNDCLFLSMAVDENNAEMNNPVLMLGVGAIAKSVETAAGREPTVIGKPSNTMFDILSETHNIDPSRTLMMGDRCNSDIIFGKNCGLHTLCLLSGFTKFELLEKYASDPDPRMKRFLADYYCNKLGDILQLVDKRYVEHFSPDSLHYKVDNNID